MDPVGQPTTPLLTQTPIPHQDRLVTNVPIWLAIIDAQLHVPREQAGTKIRAMSLWVVGVLSSHHMATLKPAEPTVGPDTDAILLALRAAGYTVELVEGHAYLCDCNPSDSSLGCSPEIKFACA
jgi:hypothetical protein